MTLARCPQFLEFGGILIGHLGIFHFNFKLEIAGVSYQTFVCFLLLKLLNTILIAESLIKFFYSFTNNIEGSRTTWQKILWCIEVYLENVFLSLFHLRIYFFDFV